MSFCKHSETVQVCLESLKIQPAKSDINFRDYVRSATSVLKFWILKVSPISEQLVRKCTYCIILCQTQKQICCTTAQGDQHHFLLPR